MAALHVALLDVDGTLIESNDAHAHAWVEAFAESRIDVPYDEIRSYIGMGGDRLLKAVAALDEDAEPGKTVAKRRRELFAQQYLGGLHATRGARDLLVWLHERGVALVVATSAGEEESRALTKAAGVEELIDFFTTKDDARASKPAADILSAALERSGFTAAESVMIGDTPYDCEAARRIDVVTIGLRCGGWSDADLGCTFVADDPADLLARWRDSPLQRLDRERSAGL